MTVGESSGVNLFRLARGIDLRPVAPAGERKSVGAERTFAEDIFGTDLIAAAVDRVTDEALRRLAAHGGGARTIVAKVRFADFTTLTRSVTLPQPSAEPAELRAAAHQAARAAGINDSVRLLGVSFHNLSAHAQLTLPWGDEDPAPVVADEPEETPARYGPLTQENSRPGLDVEHATLGRGWVVHVRGRQATVRFETVDSPPARSQVVDLDTDPLVLVPPLEPTVTP
jgi:DNA polymerase-4